MHGLVSSPSPGHFSPPKAGGGSVQVRVRFCSPPPHVTGQSLQSFQSDQLPSTRYSILKRFLKEIHGYETVSEFKKKQKTTTIFTWARSFVAWPRFFAFPRTLLPSERWWGIGASSCSPLFTTSACDTTGAPLIPI